MEFPTRSKSREEVLRLLAAAGAHDVRYREGRLFSLVYGAGDDHARLLAEAYGLYLATNGLGTGFLFQSLGRFEDELIGGTLALLGGPEGAGNVTSGGTESIIMGLRAAKQARRATGTLPDRPEVVVPRSAHPAFEKACELMGLQLVRTALRPDTTADLDALGAALSERTIAVAGSAPNYPFGTVDDIPAMAAIAARAGVHFHTDACVGAFARGTSLILYRDRPLQQHAVFRLGSWTGGPYVTPTLAGSRPGGAVAAAWAVVQYFGQDGYTRLHTGLRRTTERYMAGVAAAGFRVLGDPPMSLFAFTPVDPALDGNAVADEMLGSGWVLLRQPTTPPSLHLLLTPAHAPVCEEFCRDLREAVARVRARGASSTKTSSYTG
jgi:glutamate/tyrosine decarboxylase-like PLP-dependent enzyme